MHDDFIKEAGVPFVAHRLKRLADHLVSEIGTVINALELDVPSTAGSTLVLLASHGRMGVMEIAERLRLTHPFIVRLVAKLEALGLVSVTSDGSDLRRKWVELSAKGSNEAAQLARVNRALERVLGEVSSEAGVNPIEMVEQFEAALARAPLSDRLQHELSSGEASCVR